MKKNNVQFSVGDIVIHKVSGDEYEIINYKYRSGFILKPKEPKFDNELYVVPKYSISCMYKIKRRQE